MTLQAILGELPGGRMLPLDWQAVGRYLREHYVKSRREDERKADARRRQLFYMSAGDDEMARIVREVYQDAANREKRIRWLRYAKFNNVIRRIVHELATVYAMPARRTVSAASNSNYQEVQRLSRQHEVMLRLNRLAILHGQVAVGPRVRKEHGRSVPRIDIVTPDKFYAVAHPLDRTLLVALIFELDMAPAGPLERTPKWVVWSDTETFQLDTGGNVMEETIQAHGYSRIPWCLFSLEPPQGALLDSTAGSELEAAHCSVWFLGEELLKEVKSATRQPILAGDITAMARGQAGDSESPIELPEGAAVSVLDNTQNLDSTYISPAKYVFETAAANRGLPPAVLNHQGVQSAEARDLQRIPIEELRHQQQVPLRLFEGSLVVVKAAVLRVDLPELWFDPATWRMEYSSSRTPLNPTEEQTLFERRRAAGLDNTVSFYQRLRGNDITPEQAWKEIKQNLLVEAERQAEMRPAAAISGQLGAAAARADSGAAGAGTDGAAGIAT